MENVSRAALKLHVSQPALSRQIQDLEEELGFPLFERSAKSVRLTEAGQVFLDEARAVLNRADEAIVKARETASGNQGELQVGYAPAPTVRLLPAALRLFQPQMPKVRVKLHDFSTEELLAGLREGKLALALMVRPGKELLRGLHFEELSRDILCLAVPPQHPLAQQRSVTLIQAADQPLVVFNRKDYPDYHEHLTHLFAPTKRRLKFAEEHDSATSLITAVESGAGVAVVPKSFDCFSGPRLKLLPLTPKPPPLIIGAVWSAHGLSPAAKIFLGAAREAASQISEL